MDMNVGDCKDVWWAAHFDGQTYTWMDGGGCNPRSFENRVADMVLRNNPSIHRLGVWRIKEIKS